MKKRLFEYKNNPNHKRLSSLTTLIFSQVKTSVTSILQLTLPLFLLISFFGGALYADTFYSITIKKTEIKRKYNWSLSDWLETKQIMSFQDMWLARNQSSPFEFYIDGNLQFQNSNGNPSQTGWEGGIAAYATFVGLEGRYEKQVYERIYGLLNFRLFGYHNQGTNLTIQGGIKRESILSQIYFNPLAGANLTLYFNKAFGIEGRYQRFFSNPGSEIGRKLAGSRFQAGLFIDYLMLRVYADYFSDTNEEVKTSGALTGLRLYF